MFLSPPRDTRKSRPVVGAESVREADAGKFALD